MRYLNLVTAGISGFYLGYLTQDRTLAMNQALILMAIFILHGFASRISARARNQAAS